MRWRRRSKYMLQEKYFCDRCGTGCERDRLFYIEYYKDKYESNDKKTTVEICPDCKKDFDEFRNKIERL